VRTPPKFKDTVKFIIDDSLQIFESSSVKALQLLGKAGINLGDIVTGTARINGQQVLLMLALALHNVSYCGVTAVL